MAIGIAAKALARKLLKNKKLKKAINVTTKQTNKLKEAVDEARKSNMPSNVSKIEKKDK